MIFIYPTDTAYAIGGDALDGNVHRRVARIKGRTKGKPFPWIAASFIMAEKYCEFSPAAKKLARKHWPGPLALVLPLKKKVSTEIAYHHNRVACFPSRHSKKTFQHNW